MDVSVQQKGIAEGNADDGDRVRNSEGGDPVTNTKPKESMQRDEEIAAVPTAHAQRQGNEHSFNWTQTTPAGNELGPHPQR
jgi:hypothetical protein